MRHKRIAEKKSACVFAIAFLTLCLVWSLQMEKFKSVPPSVSEGLRDDTHQSPRGDENASMYCKLTNRQEDLMDSRNTFCLASDAAGVVVSASGEDDFLLTVTVSESKFWNGTECDLSELSWLQWVGVPTVVVVKSNSTVSFRANGLRWSDGVNSFHDRAKEAMYEPLISFDPSFYDENSSKGTAPRVFQSVLRSEWHLLQNGASRRCLGGEWLESMKGTLFLFESPNVGDEALTVVDLAVRIAQLDEAQPHAAHQGNELSMLDGVLLRARSFIFVHSHQSSWHAVDIISQLRCLCIDQSVERYKTLTSPERAYLLQCMPLRINEEDIDLIARNALHGASAAMKRSKEVIAMKRREAERSVRTSMLFSNAFAFMFDVGVVEDIPEGIIRDCCTSLVVSRDAVLRPFRASLAHSMKATGFYTALHRKIMRQPLDEPQYYNASIFQIVGLRVGELSMYLERFWRTLFVATRYDQHRDISVKHCGDRRVQFQCPPMINISSAESLMPEWRNRLERDKRWECAGIAGNADPFN